MDIVLTSANCQDFINANVPAVGTALDDNGNIITQSPSFLNEIFFNFLDTMLNLDEVIIEDKETIDNYFNPFSPYCNSSFVYFDDRLKLIDQNAVIPALAYFINDVSYKSLYSYLANFFSGVEAFYWDTISRELVPILFNGNIPPSGPPTVSFAQFITGQYTPYQNTGGIVEGIYGLYFKMYFNVFSFLTANYISMVDSAFSVIDILKPGRTFFFRQPTFQIIVNQLLSESLFYNPDVFNYLSLVTDQLESIPGLYTDQGDTTDYSPELYTDMTDTITLIEALNNIQVQYLSNPEVWVPVTSYTFNVDTFVNGSDTYTLFRWAFFISENIAACSLNNADTAYFEFTFNQNSRNNFIQSLAPAGLIPVPGDMRFELLFYTKNNYL